MGAVAVACGDCIGNRTGAACPLSQPYSHHNRSDMAALLGQPSYAHLKAADATLAATPEASMTFLKQLAEVR